MASDHMDGDMMAEFGAVEEKITTEVAAVEEAESSDSDDGAPAFGGKRKRKRLSKGGGKKKSKGGGRLKKKRRQEGPAGASEKQRGADEDDIPSGPIVPRKKSERQRGRREPDPAETQEQRHPRDNGDEYDSEEDAQETAEDRAFIDRADDDQELLNEYDQQDQQFKDRRPDGAKKKRKRPEGEFGADEAIEEKPGKSTRTQKKEQERREREQQAEQLLIEMQIAADADDRAVREKRPALARIALLPRARGLILNPSCHDALLDGPPSGTMQGVSVLHLLRRWLKPRVVSRKLMLPPLQLRAAIYGFLEVLPLDASRLRESKLGEVMAAYLTHPSESLGNRRRLKAITDRVSRSIFGRSVGLAGGTQERLRAEAEAYETAGVVPHTASSPRAAGGGGAAGSGGGSSASSSAAQASGLGGLSGVGGTAAEAGKAAAGTESVGFRARLPQSMPLTFLQNVDSAFQAGKLAGRAGAASGGAGAAATSKAQLLRRRMKEMKGAARAKGSRAEHMSIVGRELG